MRILFLIISCFVLVFLCPVDALDKADRAALAEECVGTACESQDIDVIYDDDAITLLTTYDCQNDDVVPCRLNRWGRQLRVMTSRVQSHCHNRVLLVKKLIRLLSVHLTTLVHHISQSYSTLRTLCWQYAVDCYVFAFRQIII